MLLLALTLTSTIFLLFYKDGHKPNRLNKKIKRSYLELISQPRFLQALMASAFAYAVMSFLNDRNSNKYACNGENKFN